MTHADASQETGLSPLLFSIYSCVCRPIQGECIIDTDADNTVPTGFIADYNDTAYFHEIGVFRLSCKHNYLVLKIGEKSKETVVDF